MGRLVGAGNHNPSGILRFTPPYQRIMIRFMPFCNVQEKVGKCGEIGRATFGTLVDRSWSHPFTISSHGRQVDWSYDGRHRYA